MVCDPDLLPLAQAAAHRLLSTHRRLVTAESCTGGWLATALTDLPGSSEYFECGYITYSNESKQRDLHVSPRTLAEHGAVSEATVRAMASEALRLTGADIAIAVSGIAGPDGGTPEKPVGTVWFGLAIRRGAETFDLSEARVAHFTGNRESVRRAAVAYALQWIADIQ